MVPQAADLYAHNPAQYRDIPDHLELDHLGEDDMVKIAYINREDIWYAREPAVLLMFHNARAVLQRQQLCTHTQAVCGKGRRGDRGHLRKGSELAKVFLPISISAISCIHSGSLRNGMLMGWIVNL